MAALLRAPDRTDGLEVCLGGCGCKLLKHFYFCGLCEPEGWDHHAPDMERVAKGVAGKVVVEAQAGRRKPVSKRQEKEARAFYAARGERYPWDEEPKGS